MVEKFGNIIGYHITKYERPQFTFDFSNSTLINIVKSSIKPSEYPVGYV